MKEVKELSSSKRIKKIYEMSIEEFRKGEWCSDKTLIPDSQLLRLEYIMKNGILSVHNAELKRSKDFKGDDATKPKKEE